MTTDPLREDPMKKALRALRLEVDGSIVDDLEKRLAEHDRYVIGGDELEYIDAPDQSTEPATRNELRAEQRRRAGIGDKK